jgi:hypothetical protein
MFTDVSEGYAASIFRIKEWLSSKYLSDYMLTPQKTKIF